MSIKRTAGGDGGSLAEQRERFTHLYRREHGWVYRFLARRSDPSVAADVAQETFTTAWRRLADVPEDEAKARAWLYTVARNHLFHHERSSARRTALSVRIASHVNESVDGPEAQVIAQRDLARAWNSLSPHDQEVLALVGWEELTVTEAARVLGVSTVTVRSRLRSARSSLRDALGRPPIPPINNPPPRPAVEPSPVVPPQRSTARIAGDPGVEPDETPGLSAVETLGLSFVETLGLSFVETTFPERIRKGAN